jgi:hypothetical protein
MRTIATRIYRAQQGAETIRVSLEELSESDLDDDYRRVPGIPLKITFEDLEIPLVESEIHMGISWWNGGEGLAPHLHFNCSDLEDGDPNPKFVCCDSCAWDSLVWLNWDGAKAEQLRSEQVGPDHSHPDKRTLFAPEGRRILAGARKPPVTPPHDL